MATRQIRPIRVEGNIAYVPLTQGYEAVIDAADVPLVSDRSWHVQIKRNSKGGIRSIYAISSGCVLGKVVTILMHRVISGIQEGVFTDHIDGNGLNNRRSNLRPATLSQNAANRRPKDGTSSGAKGVTRVGSKWQAQIRAGGKYYYLGLHETVRAAADAYAKASAAMHGQYGRISR